MCVCLLCRINETKLKANKREQQQANGSHCIRNEMMPNDNIIDESMARMLVHIILD